MKLGYLCADPGIPVFGRKGSSLHVQEMCRAFQKLGMEVTLFARRIGDSRPADLQSMRFVPLPGLANLQGEAREQAALASNVQIRHRVIEHGPFDMVYERYSLWSHAALTATRATGTATVLEVNSPLIEEQRRYRVLYDQDGALAASRKVFDAADLIIAVSDEVADYLTRFPQTRSKVQVIPNGVNTERFSDTATARAQRDGFFTVGFIGTLKPWHGVELLLQAFRKFNQTAPVSRLLIVGDGPERAALERSTHHLGITDSVEFTGAVAPDRVPQLLARMDVGMAPYPALKSFYFSPLKLYEYLAAELPVIASSIGQIKSLLEVAGVGIPCKPGSIPDMVNALNRLYADPGLRAQMGGKGRALVLSQYTWDSVAHSVVQLAGVHLGNAATQRAWQ